VEESDVILFHKNSGRGVPPNPRTTVACHLHGRGAPDPGHLMALVGRAAIASLSAVASAPRPGFRSSIIRREDVEFLGRKPETGGTPTPPGVEFVRYRRSHGLGFHETAAKTPRMALRAVLRVAGHGCHTAGQSPPYARLLAPSAITAKLPAGRSVEDHVGRIVGPDGAALGCGPGDGIRGVEHPADRWSYGGPEKRGQRGRSPPPASLGDSRSVAPGSTLACFP